MPKNLDYWLKRRQEHLEFRESSINEWISKLTPIESIAFLTLLDLSDEFGRHNFNFLPQKEIGRYRVDFYVKYQPIDNHKILKELIIECDGHDFHERTKEQAAHDKERDRFFIKEGFTVFRYTGSELVNDRFKLYSDVEEYLLPDKHKEGFGYTKNKIHVR